MRLRCQEVFHKILFDASRLVRLSSWVAEVRHNFRRDRGLNVSKALDVFPCSSTPLKIAGETKSVFGNGRTPHGIFCKTHAKLLLTRFLSGRFHFQQNRPEPGTRVGSSGIQIPLWAAPPGSTALVLRPCHEKQP